MKLSMRHAQIFFRTMVRCIPLNILEEALDTSSKVECAPYSWSVQNTQNSSCGGYNRHKKKYKQRREDKRHGLFIKRSCEHPIYTDVGIPGNAGVRPLVPTFILYYHNRILVRSMYDICHFAKHMICRQMNEEDYHNTHMTHSGIIQTVRKN